MYFPSTVNYWVRNAKITSDKNSHNCPLKKTKKQKQEQKNPQPPSFMLNLVKYLMYLSKMGLYDSDFLIWKTLMIDL